MDWNQSHFDLFMTFAPQPKPKGPWFNRFAIHVFTFILGVLCFWLLGFVVDDIASIEGPQYDTIEAKHLNKGLLEKKAAQEAQVEEFSKRIENQQESQLLLGASSQNLQQTINQLLDLQKQGLEKNVAFSDKEQATVASSLNLFLENQKQYQELNQSLSEMLRQKQVMEEEERRTEQQLENERKPAKEEFESLNERHRWKIALLQLAVLLPLLGIGALLIVKQRGSIYYPFYLASSGAILLKVALVIHEYFPSRYFHYILIGALIVAVARLLIYLIRATAFPKVQTLLKQYREAYERFLCPVCEYPIRRGPRRFLFWTRRTVNKLVVPDPSKEEEQSYLCPTCGTSIFEECPSCHKIRHALLPYCEHCGNEKTLLEQETVR